MRREDFYGKRPAARGRPIKKWKEKDTERKKGFLPLSLKLSLGKPTGKGGKRIKSEGAKNDGVDFKTGA